jgi:hypothetical protein
MAVVSGGFLPSDHNQSQASESGIMIWPGYSEILPDPCLSTKKAGSSRASGHETRGLV